MMVINTIQNICKIYPLATVTGSFGLYLHLNHRMPTDVDFLFLDETSKIPMKTSKKNKVLIEGASNGFEFDFLSSEYSKLRKIEKVITLWSIRVLSLLDISSGKLNAIFGRAQKSDYYDLYFILQKYSLNQLIIHYRKMFPQKDVNKLLKCLVFFDDVEKESAPFLIKPVEWVVVKKTVADAVKNVCYE